MQAWLTHVVVILIVRANGITDPAVKMLCVAAAKRKWPAKPDEEVTLMVRDLMMRRWVDYEEVCGLCVSVPSLCFFITCICLFYLSPSAGLPVCLPACFCACLSSLSVCLPA